MSDPGPGKLKVLVDQAHLLVTTVIPWKVFVELDLNHQRFRTAPIAAKRPQWKASFIIPRENEVKLDFKLFDRSMFANSLKGAGCIDLEPVLHTGSDKQTLKVVHNRKTVADLMVELEFSPGTRPSHQRALCGRVLDFPASLVKQPLREELSLDTWLSGLTVDALNFETQIYRSVNGKQAIYNAQVRNTNLRVAVKITYCLSRHEYSVVKQEAFNMSQVRHPNICKVYTNLLDMKYGTYNNLMVMEKIEGGDLAEHIKKRKQTQQPWREAELSRYFAALISAFTELQRKRIVHSDIKPQNIVLTPQEKIKVIDFGISLISKAEFFTTVNTFKVGGTVPYFSPKQFSAYIEFLSGQNPDGKVRHDPYKSDVFSLGLTFLHMANLILPSGLNHFSPELQESINQAVAQLQYSSNIKNLITRMLAVEESQRPDFLNLAQHLNLS